jgi:hypothetical protein
VRIWSPGARSPLAQPRRAGPDGHGATRHCAARASARPGQPRHHAGSRPPEGPQSGQLRAQRQGGLARHYRGQGLNVGDWISHKADAADLVVTTVTGPHSEALKKLADGKTRVDTIEVQTISGENTWIIVTFTNARIRGYAADASGKTEQWKAVDFDHVDIKRTSIGKPR